MLQLMARDQLGFKNTKVIFGDMYAKRNSFAIKRHCQIYNKNFGNQSNKNKRYYGDYVTYNFSD